jgi:hypothetical protein
MPAVQAAHDAEQSPALVAQPAFAAPCLLGVEAMQEVPGALAPEVFHALGAGQLEDAPGTVDQSAVIVQDHDLGMGLVNDASEMPGAQKFVVQVGKVL